MDRLFAKFYSDGSGSQNPKFNGVYNNAPVRDSYPIKSGNNLNKNT